MKFIKRHITLHLDFTDNQPELTSAELQEAMNSLGRDSYSDGRHGLPIEVTEYFIRQILHQAMFSVLCQKMKAKFGNEEVPNPDGNGSSFKWMAEAEKAFKDVPDPFCHNIGSVEVVDGD